MIDTVEFDIRHKENDSNDDFQWLKKVKEKLLFEIPSKSLFNEVLNKYRYECTDLYISNTKLIVVIQKLELSNSWFWVYKEEDGSTVYKRLRSKSDKTDIDKFKEIMLLDNCLNIRRIQDKYTAPIYQEYIEEVRRIIYCHVRHGNFPLGYNVTVPSAPFWPECMKSSINPNEVYPVKP